VPLLNNRWQVHQILGDVPAAIADLTRGRTVIDARNCLDAAAWRAAGWTLHALGRGTPAEARSVVFA